MFGSKLGDLPAGLDLHFRLRFLLDFGGPRLFYERGHLPVLAVHLLRDEKTHEQIEQSLRLDANPSLAGENSLSVCIQVEELQEEHSLHALPPERAFGVGHWLFHFPTNPSDFHEG